MPFAKGIRLLPWSYTIEFGVLAARTRVLAQWTMAKTFKPFSKFQMMDSGTLLNIMIYKIKIQNRTIMCKLKYFFHHV